MSTRKKLDDLANKCASTDVLQSPKIQIQEMDTMDGMYDEHQNLIID